MPQTGPVVLEPVLRQPPGVHMRLALRPESPLDQLGLWLNLAPTPVAETMFGMTSSRVLMAGVRLGVFAALAKASAEVGTLAAALKLDPEGLTHLLECLAAMGHLDRRGGVYALSRRARRWLDPVSPTYVGTFLDFNYDQWEWWSQLDRVLTAGNSFRIHGLSPEDAGWNRYITAMFELSRLAAPEVARKVRVPAGATRLLDVAGGHGWFAAEVCERHPGLEATVVDLPGSVRVGRALLQKAGRAGWVRHLEADIFTGDLGGRYDAALYFQTLRHFTPEQNLALFRRIYDVLEPGGSLAVMDYLTPPADRRPDPGAFIGFHYYLTTGGAFYTLEALKRALTEAGFVRLRCADVLRLPYQKLCVAWKPR